MNTALFRFPLIHIPAAAAVRPCTRDEIRLFDYYGARHGAQANAGGFFEFVPTGEGAVTVAVGDVLGDGAAAPGIRSGARAAVRNMAARHAGNIAAALRELNRTLYWLSPDDYYTSCFYAHLDPARRLIRYANAGHEPALLIHADGRAIRLDHSGGVLGLSQRTQFQEHARMLNGGDVIVAAGGAPGIWDPAQWQVWETAASHTVRANPRTDARELLFKIVAEFLRGGGAAASFGEWTLAVVRVRAAESADLGPELESYVLAGAA